MQSAVLAMIPRPSVSLSNTVQYHVKTTPAMIVQPSLRIAHEIPKGTQGAASPNERRVRKWAIFSQQMAISQKWCNIGP